MHPVLIQLCIAAFGLTALAMALTGGDKARKWAPIVGLVGQPFWFMATVPTGQWGMVILCGCYTLTYIYAGWKQWVAPALSWPELELEEPAAEPKPEGLRRDSDANHAPVTRDRVVTEPGGFVLLTYPPSREMVAAGVRTLVQSACVSPDQDVRNMLDAMVRAAPVLQPRPTLNLRVLAEPPKPGELARCRTERCTFEGAIYPCSKCDGRSHFLARTELEEVPA